MGTMTISITKDVYCKLKKMERKDESFSEIIHELINKKQNVAKCFGLLKEDKNVEAIEKEVSCSRKARWE